MSTEKQWFLYGMFTGYLAGMLICTWVYAWMAYTRAYG